MYVFRSAHTAYSIIKFIGGGDSGGGRVGVDGIHEWEWEYHAKTFPIPLPHYNIQTMLVVLRGCTNVRNAGLFWPSPHKSIDELQPTTLLKAKFHWLLLFEPQRHRLYQKISDREPHGQAQAHMHFYRYMYKILFQSTI